MHLSSLPSLTSLPDVDVYSTAAHEQVCPRLRNAVLKSAAKHLENLGQQTKPKLNDNNNIEKLNVLDADKVMLRSSPNELKRQDNEIPTNIETYRNFKFLPFIPKIRPRWTRKDDKKIVATFNVNGEYVPLISSHIQTL